MARQLAVVFDRIGALTWSVDTPASPPRLEPVVVIDAPFPRLAVWALGDSVWLDRDWRRPGETNVVAITDHVGVANNGRALGLVEDFFARRPLNDDESSWRGALVSLLRYAFEPWRPHSADVP